MHINLFRICLRHLGAVLIISAGFTNLRSQTYFFDNYSTPQGFESKVFSIAQDSLHYVWLGTQTGVTMFDGSTFRAYTTEDGLAPGGVRVLFIDRDHVLWLGHEGGGITRYRDKSFEQIMLTDSLLQSNITSICQDRDNQIWITTQLDGALRFSNPREPAAFLDFEHYLKGKSLGDQVFNSLVTSKGELYFITNVGIRKYNKADNSFENFAPDGLFKFFPTSVMFEDSKGNLWFGTYNGGLSKQDRAGNFTQTDTRHGLASNWITSITEDRNGNVWIGHWKDNSNSGGISRIDGAGKIQVFNTSNGLHDDHIWCIREDTEGNMLIGTTEQGLEIFKGEKFISLSTQDGLLHNQVNAVIEDPKGAIWFGTNQGIAVYTDDGKKPSFRYYTQLSNVISNQIRFFKKDRQGNIWIGTADQGVMLYNTSRNQFVAQTRINSYFPYQTISKGVTALEISRDGHLWIGTIDGLVEFDIEAETYVATHTQEAGLAGNHITALYADSRGDLWIGSDMKKGLTRMHNRVFTVVKNFGEVSPTCIAEDKSGHIWIGTPTRGVWVLLDDSVKQYTMRDGLLSDLINVLICDKDNHMYAGTNKGVNKIDRQNDRIFSYTRRVGFTGIETKSNAATIDHRGFLWLGTANGAIRCNLDLLSAGGDVEPVVRIAEMEVKGVPSEMFAGRRFSSNENDIVFRYSCVSLTNPEGIAYQVMLKGYHDSWQDQKNDNTIAFTKLQPGRYTLMVRARNDQGIWTNMPAEYSFRILAPFYQRAYFIITAVLLTLAFIIVFIKIRERNLVMEKKILEEKVNERTQALSEANDQLSMRNRDITDSITYAKRIQLAILPPDIPFDNTFIFFKPKDIVSGDFYWMNSAGGREYLAAVDCTGHGVPGAFMSFIGFTSLNKIIIEQGIYTPSAILDRLNEEVAVTLHQKGEDIVNDGMDISLVSYSPGTGVLEYAGAFNPLIIVRKGEIIEVKADRFAIGRAYGKDRTFTNHSMQLESGDSLFLFSDGYADQFGGSDGKKFKISALKELLASVGHLDTDRQKETIERTFENWKVNQEQIDDVLIIGRKF